MVLKLNIGPIALPLRALIFLLSVAVALAVASPCQSEMPVLARAQVDHPGVHLVFVNQGETSGHVDGYLESHDLRIRNSLLDPAHAVAKAVRAVGFPTTLFYDANGRLLATHLGPFSKATFTQALKQFYPIAVSKDD
jgi:YD repeat-containing protein